MPDPLSLMPNARSLIFHHWIYGTKVAPSDSQNLFPQTGWDDGVRSCLPLAQEGRIAAHGDVVQWGECECVVLAEAAESSWGIIWKQEVATKP